MKYSVGIALDNYDLVGLDSKELGNSISNDVVIVLGESSSNQLHEYYTTIRRLIIRNNNVKLILDGDRSKIRKHISMLMTSYGRYDIYRVDDINEIDDEFIRTIEERVPTIEEVTEYIGEDIATYSEISNVLLELTKNVENGDMDGLKKTVYENMEVIKNSSTVIDYMKKVMDSANAGTDEKIAKLKEQIDKLESKSKSDNIKIDTLTRNQNALKESNDFLEKEARRAETRRQELEEQVNKSGPVIKAYSTLQTSVIKGYKPVSVLYFKEITKIPYINTLIIQIANTINKLLKDAPKDKPNVRLIIYDNTSQYQIYKPLTIVDSAMMTNNRANIVNHVKEMVITEPNQSLLEDILKVDFPVVIIYDRLRQQRDILSGNMVTKFYVANSKNDVKAIKSLDSAERIITPEGVSDGTIWLGRIDKYEGLSPAAQMSKYVSVKDLKDKSSRLIFDKILKVAHVELSM